MCYRLVAVSVAIAMIVAGGASAQTAMPTQNQKGVLYPDGKVYPEAPVGHRQPTVGSLSPDVARREQREESLSATPARPGTERSDIDPQLRICKGC